MISKFTLALSFRQNGQLEERLYHFDQQFAVPAVGEVIALPDRNPHDSEFLTVQRRHFALFAGKDGDWIYQVTLFCEAAQLEREKSNGDHRSE
jgi:hypothetical protein